MHKLTTVVIAVLTLAATLAAQQPATAPSTTVPRLVRVADTFHPASGPAAPVESVTLSIYREEQGGTALWSETQNVAVDAEGRYAVLMGSTLADGVPADLFTMDEPRWLGVQFNRPGEAEQPRTQLVSVPYALKAVDAETLGGKPASAYLLAPSIAETSVGGGTSPSTIASTGSSAMPAVKSTKPHVTSGSPNCIGMFTNSTDLGCSVIWQNGINIGIDTMNPGAALDLGAGSIRVANYSAPSSGAGLEMAYIPVNNSGYLFAYDRGASVAKDLNIGGSGAAITVKASGNVGVGVAGPASKLDVAGDINFSGSILYQGTPVLQLSGASGSNTALGAGAQVATAATGNTAVGHFALGSDTTGATNTATGGFALAGNTTGYSNSADGFAALASNTTGYFNTATGFDALYSNTTGYNNTATGDYALYRNTSGLYNTATGFETLSANTTGYYNTADGANSLGSNTIGTDNTAIGMSTLSSNTTGVSNTGIGSNALVNNVGGSYSTATGAYALYYNSADFNTANGYQALTGNVGGGSNTAVGSLALLDNTSGNFNTALGDSALDGNSTGSNNIAIGHSAAGSVGSGMSNNIHVGSEGSAADSGTIRIGAPGTQTSFFAAGISGATTANNDAVPVVIDSAGQLGVAISSRRYKEDIQDMGDASSGLMRLRPVTFRYKKPFEDGSKPVQYGLIAEEVAEVYPDLVAHGADGQIETVKYQLLPTMLLNEVQRQERTIQEQQRSMEQQAREIETLKAKLAALSSLEARLAALEAATAGNR